MPRSSRWAGNDEMWEYAAELIRGGLTYSDVSGRLSTPERRKKFGLVVVPSSDTIRYQIKRRGLLDRRRPGSALSPDDLSAHHGGLAFLGLALREQINVEDTGRSGPSRQWLRRLRAGNWHGFSAGPLYAPVAREDEEFEVYEDWTEQLLDPRELAYYSYFLEHLEATASGRTIAESLDALFESTDSHRVAFHALWAIAEKLIDERVAGIPEASSTERVEDVMGRVKPKGASERARNRPSARRTIPRNTGEANAEDAMADGLRSRPENLQLVRSWKKAVRASEKLKRSLKPSSLVRRVVQDGQCSICRLDDYS